MADMGSTKTLFDDLEALTEINRVAQDLLEASRAWPSPNRYTDSAFAALRFIAKRDQGRTEVLREERSSNV